jgi:CBS domain-containing protein
VPEELDVTVTVAEGDEAAGVVAAATRGVVNLIVVKAVIARAIARQAPCLVVAAPATRGSMRVAERMRAVAVSVPPTASLSDAQGAMVAHGLAWVPVVEDGRLVGLVGDEDIAAARPSPATTLTIREVAHHLTTIPVAAVMRPDPPVVVSPTPRWPRPPASCATRASEPCLWSKVAGSWVCQRW